MLFLDSSLIIRLEDLRLEHARLVQRLYRLMAGKLYGAPWETLTKAQRDEAISDCMTMCENWDRDPALRESYAAGSAEIVDLVALQHQIVEQIREVESQVGSVIGNGEMKH